MQIRSLSLTALLCGVALVTGCAKPTQKSLYYWGQYQPQVYEHLKGDGKGPEEQIAALESDLQKAQSKNAALPPGYYAHMGMLYLKTGKNDQVKQAFETEKTLYPESSTFMDFLLKKFKN
ncbi:hypothetical protein HNQ59_002130 [Chitinivorax tropicus]|uniref:DUF4810 domain-containing protein n=1 Tax=Chitinivorax tropicus TaxID=714531 RepID=A0A840MRH9_9PROT|nr:DUF4810 domain-containing protein [Chitinivorax tropicus]MBB5018833.1 hypothetical protein [Chitinivorax tropicus]